jgi:Werner syndrome ATP-dependent helicase
MSDYNDALKKHFGFDEFRGKQLEIVRAIIEDKRDACIIMFTGAGKSLCYQFPAVYTNKIAIVISPLISLSNDQAMKMKDLNIPVCCLNSTVKFKSIVKDKIAQNKYRLVYVTPEFIIKEEKFLKDLYEKDLIISVNLDEAHTLSSWSQDFREAYAELGCIKKWLPYIPVMTLTATATKKVQNDIITIMKLKNPLIIKTTFDRPNLFLNVRPKTKDVMNDLLPILKKNEPTIIYCQKRKITEKLASLLNKNGIVCACYHAGMETTDRESVHKRFSNDDISCVTATIAFGMGIDITIRKVIHYGIPQDMESYYQEIGRAGRDGKDSYCYLFYELADMNTNNFLISQITNTTYRNHRIQLALVMKNFVFSSECRRKYVLAYFDEQYEHDNCKSCDNCMKGNGPNFVAKTHDFSKEAYLLLRVMVLTRNIYGGCMLIDILRGSDSKKIVSDFKKFDVYGKGNKFPVKWWKVLLSLLVNNKYVSESMKPGIRGTLLNVSPKGMEWLKNYEKDKENTTLILPIPQEMPELLKEVPNENNTIIIEDKKIIKNTPQKKKIISAQCIAELLEEGKDINEVAKELRITPITVEGHICNLYKKGYDIDLELFGFNDKVYNFIITKMKGLPDDMSLPDIKNKMPNHITDLQIKLSLIKQDQNNL